MSNAALSTFLNVLRRAYSPRPGPGTPWPLFFFSLRNILLNKKKTPLLLAFLLIPAVVTVLVGDTLDTYTPDTEDVAPDTGGRAWFQDIMSAVFFPLILPIVTAVYASGAIGEEVEGKTLPYLFTRPIYRSWTLLAKSISSFTASALLAIIALTLTWFLALSYTENPLDGMDQLLGYWSAVALTVLATGGTFLLVGVSMRPAVIVIVIYTFVWETVLGNVLPSAVLKYSFVWYERAYINDFIGREAGFVTRLLVDIPTAGEAVTVLVVFGVLGILGALLVVSWRDYNV